MPIFYTFLKRVFFGHHSMLHVGKHRFWWKEYLKEMPSSMTKMKINHKMIHKQLIGRHAIEKLKILEFVAIKEQEECDHSTWNYKSKDTVQEHWPWTKL